MDPSNLSDLVADVMAVRSFDPENLQIDEWEYAGSFSANGTITQPTGLTLDDHYYGFLIGISGWIEEPGLAVANHHNILWNVTLDGHKQRTVFRTDHALSRLLNTDGSHHPLWYPRGGFRFEPGRKIGVRLAQRSGSSWQGNASKSVGLVLSMLLIHKSIIERQD